MKNFRFVLPLVVGILLSISVYSQGSGSAHGSGGQDYRFVQPRSSELNPSPSFGENRASVNRSFEVTRTVKGNLVEVEKGLFALKTAKGEVLNLKITPETKIRSKKDKSGLSDGKLVKVTYIPGELTQEELAAVRVKVLD